MGADVFESLDVELQIEFGPRPLGKTANCEIVFQKLRQQGTVLLVDLLAGGLDQLLLDFLGGLMLDLADAEIHLKG